MEWEEEPETEAEEQKKEKQNEITGSQGTALEKEPEEELYGETVLLFEGRKSGPSAFVSREPGELATIFLEKDLTVIGKLANASDAVIPVPYCEPGSCTKRRRILSGGSKFQKWNSSKRHNAERRGGISSSG